MAMNRDRNRRRPIKPPVEDTAESLIDRVDKLSNRIKNCNHFDSLTIAHARSLLQTVTYILSNSPVDNLEYEDEDEDSDDDDDPSIPTIDLHAQANRKPPLNLRNQWAGDLPSAPSPSNKLTPKQQLERQKRIASLKSKDGISGGHPDVYETTYDLSPTDLCGDCGGQVMVHAWDRKLPDQQTSTGILRAKILCDYTRAYVAVPGSNGD